MRANARRSSPQIGVRLRVTHLTLIRSRGKLKMVPNDNPSAAPRALLWAYHALAIIALVT
jgi:hypothetical protein